MTPEEKRKLAAKIFTGGGEMGALMRSYDWSKTSLGSVENWPQSLKTALRIVLTSRQPMFVWWGKELINFYNDAYKAIVGGKHPKALGQPASEVWREIWDQVGPRAESAMINNEGTYDEALQLIMERNGYSEETYYTFSYSPIPNDQGGTGGIICANTDDTQRIIGERQLSLLRELAAKTVDARTLNEACDRSVKSLETNTYDFPSAMLYLVDVNQKTALLTGTYGIERGHRAAPETVNFDQDSVWPFQEVIETYNLYLISDLEAIFGSLPKGPWKRPPHQAVVVPIALSGQTKKAGVLVVALNPFRIFDDHYRRFVELVAAQISASINNAQAYEQECKRAEALAEIDRAKTVFFSNISHEFRTPLTLMLSPLEEMLAVADDTPLGRQRQPLEMIYRNGLRLQKLVNTLLDFSRIEAGRIQAIYEPTDLATLTSELASLFRSLIEKAGMRLQVDCPPLPFAVYVDYEMWEKIVLNLLSNAFKFTFEGQITVSLQWAQKQVELVVQDTGVGIAPEELPFLFERFHPVKQSKGRTFEGSRIGLSLVQELVRLHGGKIEVTSTINQGSRFMVSIPTGMDHLPQDRISATRMSTNATSGAAPYVEEALRWISENSEEESTTGEVEESQTNPNFYSLPNSKARILLADDNADMREYVKRLLSQRYNVETVNDGLAALASINRHQPDLVLTDVMMPRLDGLGLLRKLRAEEKTRQIPIILLSARVGSESHVEGLDAGANDYLTKPFSARELLARIEANLKMAQLRKESAQREQELRFEAEAARDQISKILESISDAFVFFDHQWHYVYVNDQASRLLQKTPSELLGKQLWQVFPESVAMPTYQEFHRAVRQQVVVVFEDFSQYLGLWFEIHAYPSPDGLAVYFQDITQRKQTEALLRQSQHFTQQIVETVPGMVFVYDLLENRNIYINQQITDLLGYTPKQIQEMGSNLVSLLTHPDDLAQLLDYLNEFNSTPDGVVRGLEYRNRDINGEWHWLYIQSLIFNRTPDGRASQILSVSIDISDRKQFEENLREQELFLQILTNNVPVMLWTALPDGTMNFVSQPWMDYTGLNLTTASQQGWKNLIHPDDFPETQERWNQATQTGQLYEMTHRLKRADGHYMWFISRAVLTYDDQLNPLRWVGSAVNIELQKQTEAALRESEGRFRMMSDSAPVLVWMSGTDTLCNFFNQPWLDFTGRSLEQELGNGWIESVHPDDLDYCRNTYLNAFHSRQAFEMDYRLQNANGEYRWLFDRGVPRFTLDGDFVGYIGTCTDITERRQVEQALRESEEALRQNLAILNTINEATPTLIYVKDLQGRMIIANASVLRVVGKPESEVIGYTDLEFLLNRDDAEVIVATDRQIMETGQMQIVEETIEGLSGSHTFLSAKSPYRNKQGNIIGLIGVSFDITDRKQIEEAIRESEQKLKLALQTSKLSDWQLDLVTGALESSGQYQDNFGLDPKEDLSYERFVELIHPDDRALFQQAVQEAIENHTDYDVEYRTIWPDGSLHWILARGKAIYSSEGKPLRLIGVTLNFTDRKLIEEALRESEERLNLAIEASQLGLWHWNLRTDTLILTDQCKALFGLSRDTIMSYQVFLEALHPDDRQRTHEAIHQSIYNREIYDIEYRTLWPDGTIRWITAKGSCAYDTTEKIIQMMGVALDITDRKLNEEELKIRAQELTELNKILAKTTNVLEDRNEELDQFVYIVSHDLKAPLRGISNLSQWIADDLGDQLPEENQRQMQLLRDRVIRMERLIDGLLNYSRAIRTQTLAETVDVAELLTEVIDSLDPPSSFTLEVQPDLPTLITQRLPLSQVFANLISNAIKHHGGTEGKITISAEDQKNYYQFAITDNGQGIPPEAHEKIFIIFETAGLSKSQNNTGIGLALVKKIVEKHGGSIHLNSEVGQGTTFRFTWPKSE